MNVGPAGGLGSFRTGRHAAGWAMGFVFALSAASAVPSVAQEVRYSGSLSYSTGSYVFAERTHSFWFSNGFGVSGHRWSASTTLPVILQNSGVLSVVGGTGVPTGGEGSGAVSRRQGNGTIGTRRRDGSGSGAPTPSDSVVVFRNAYEVEIGDPSVRLSLDALTTTGTVRSLSFNLGAKVPIRSVESGVGTGAWDVGAGASLALGLGSVWMFADAGYWWFGDMPDLELSDAVSYSLGLSRLVAGGRMSILANVSGSSRIVPTADPPLSASLGLSRFFTRGSSLSVGLSAGLTESASDVSAYVGWSLPLGAR